MAKARFFYALRPDALTADRLATLAAQAAARWGGRAFVAADIHLTLAFVGMRALDEQPKFESILQGLPSHFVAGGDPASMPLALSRLGSFGHGVLWVGPQGQQRIDTARSFAHRLAGEIRERLRAARIDFDDRPLKLHATLVRGAQDFGRRPAIAPAAGTVTAVAVEPGFEPIIAREWSLALGASGPGSTPQHRYHWSNPESRRTEEV